MVLLVWINSECTCLIWWLVACVCGLFKLVISSMCVLILGGWYGTDSRWKFVLTEKWTNQMCQKVKIVVFTWPQVH